MLFNWVVLASELIKLQQEREHRPAAPLKRPQRRGLGWALRPWRRPSVGTPADGDCGLGREAFPTRRAGLC